MIQYLNGEEFEVIASARQAGPPFSDQNGDLVGVDYESTDGGICNLRFTKQQARALRDVLTLHLKSRKRKTVSILRAKNKTLKTIIES